MGGVCSCVDVHASCVTDICSEVVFMSMLKPHQALAASLSLSLSASFSPLLSLPITIWALGGCQTRETNICLPEKCLCGVCCCCCSRRGDSLQGLEGLPSTAPCCSSALVHVFAPPSSALPSMATALHHFQTRTQATSPRLPGSISFSFSASSPSPSFSWPRHCSGRIHQAAVTQTVQRNHSRTMSTRSKH